jgi:WD40 repeat protein
MIRSISVTDRNLGLPLSLLVFVLMFGAAWSAEGRAFEPPLPIAEIDRKTPVDYTKEILPLLKQNCLACHHAKEAEGGLVMETLESIVKGGDSGTALVAGKSAESLLFTRAVGGDDPLMPPEDNGVGAKSLSPEQLALLKLWIDQGSKVGKTDAVEAIQWQPIPESIRTVYSLQVSPDGNFTVVGRGNRVIVVDTATHEVSGRLVDPSLTVGEVTDVDLIQSVAVSPQADLIATGGFRTVRLWRRSSQELAVDGGPFANAVGLLAVHPGQDLTAFVNAIGDIEIWSLRDQQLKNTLKGNAERVVDLVWSDSADSLLSVDEMGHVTNWDINAATRRFEHDAGGPIKQLVWSPDGSQIAWINAAGKPQLLRLKTDLTGWDMQQETLGGVTEATAIALLTKPALVVAVASGNGTVSLVNVADNKVLRKMEHGASVASIELSVDESKIVTGGVDGVIQVWNQPDGKNLFKVREGRGDALTIASAKRDSERQKSTLTRMNAQAEALKKSLEKEDAALKKVVEQHQKAVTALKEGEKKRVEAVAAVTTTEAKVAKAATDIATAKKTIDAVTLTLVSKKSTVDQVNKQLETHKAELKTAMEEAAKATEAAEQAEKLRVVAKAKADSIQKMIDDANAALKKANDEAAADQAKIDQSKKTLADAEMITQKSGKELETQKKAAVDAESAKQKNEADVAKRKQALDTATAAQKRATAAIPKHQQVIRSETTRKDLLDQRLASLQSAMAAPGNAVSDLTLGPNEVVVAARQDGSIDVYRLSDGHAVAEFVSANRQPLHVASFGSTVVGFNLESPPKSWSIDSSWVLERTIGAVDDPTVISDRVTAMDFSPDGKSLAVGSGPPSRSGQVVVFDVRNGRSVRDFGDVHSDTVLGLSFSPDGRVLASSAADKTIRLLDLRRGELMRSLEGHTHHVLSVAWQDDGQTIASASADQTVKVWNVETGEQRRTISGFSKEITSVAFIQATNQVALACADGNVRLYDTSNGKSLRSFNASGDFLYTLSVTPDGAGLVSAGQSGKVRFWTVKDGKLVHELD